MSSFTLDRTIHQIGSKAGWQTFSAAPEVLLADTELSDDERTALVRADIVALQGLGVNEYLLLRIGGWTGQRAPDVLRAAGR